MRGSIKLFDILGISVEIHITFVLLPLFFLIYGGLKAMVLVLIVFLCVTFHELMHSVVAKAFGIRVRSITLLPIGGLASMERIPERPGQEFLISTAGPLSNILLAGVLFFAFYRSSWMPKAVLMNPEAGDSWLHTIALVPWINVTLALFNLLPAFPMDGGRILRDILASRMSYMKATRIAVNVGHLFAVIFGYIGIVHGRPVLLLIAVFIYMAASTEETQVSIKEVLKDYRVKDILKEQFLTVDKNAAISDVLGVIFHSRQEDFPVMEGGVMVGFVTRADIISGMHSYGTAKPVASIMRADIPSVTTEDRLIRVQHVMEEAQARALPVVRGSQVVGVVTLEDIGRIYSVMAQRR